MVKNILHIYREKLHGFIVYELSIEGNVNVPVLWKVWIENVLKDFVEEVLLNEGLVKKLRKNIFLVGRGKFFQKFFEKYNHPINLQKILYHQHN